METLRLGRSELSRETAATHISEQGFALHVANCALSGVNGRELEQASSWRAAFRRVRRARLPHTTPS